MRNPHENLNWNCNIGKTFCLDNRYFEQTFKKTGSGRVASVSVAKRQYTRN